FALPRTASTILAFWKPLGRRFLRACRDWWAAYCFGVSIWRSRAGRRGHYSGGFSASDSRNT
ncbi:unnamed protein product, partial [Laminaria digitata]